MSSKRASLETRSPRDEVICRDGDAATSTRCSVAVASQLLHRGQVVDGVCEGEAGNPCPCEPAPARRAPRSALGRERASQNPSQIGEIDRSRLRARTSSCTPGLSWRPAASRGKCRTLTSGGSLWVGPDVGDPLERDGPSAMRRSFAASVPPKTAPRLQRRDRRGSRARTSASSRPNRASSGTPDPAADEREVAVDPDVRAGRHLLAVEQRIDDQEELLVLAAGGVEELRCTIGAGLPVDEERSGAARVAGFGSRPSGRTAATAAGSAQYSMTRKSPT